MEQTILTLLLEIVVYSTAIFLIVWLFRTAFSKWLSPTLKYALWFLVILRCAFPYAGKRRPSFYPAADCGSGGQRVAGIHGVAG
jgi:beta-lactamase regulating signal transducer with metallopeptidase domain